MADMAALTPLPPAGIAPAADVVSGDIALRCPNCNRLSSWKAGFLRLNAGGAAACPNCAQPFQLPAAPP